MPPSPAPSRTSSTGRGLPLLAGRFRTMAGSRGPAFLALALTPLLGGGQGPQRLVHRLPLRGFRR